MWDLISIPDLGVDLKILTQDLTIELGPIIRDLILARDSIFDIRIETRPHY